MSIYYLLNTVEFYIRSCMLYLMMFMDVMHHRSTTLVSNVEVMTTLKPFLSDITKSATVRKAILRLAEKVNFS